MKNYRIENEGDATEYFGKSFLTVPRVILNQLQSANLIVRQQGQLHLLLFAVCYFKDGYAMVNDCKVSCRKGEYVGTQAELARLSGINASTVNILLHKMADMKLITINRITNGSRIRVNGYVDFTTVPETTNASLKADAPTLAAELNAAKKELGGRRMEDDNAQTY